MDKAKLIDAMKEQKLSHGEMCTALKMSRSAFWRKCNGSSEFTLSEIQKIIDILQLKNPMEIFFAPKVS